MLEFAGFIKAAALAFAFRPSAASRVERRALPGFDAPAKPSEVITLAEHRSIEPKATSPSKLPPSAPRKPAVAARRFLAWLEAEGYAEPGQELFWSNGPTYPYRDPKNPGSETGIWELYRWHCRDDNTISIPETRLAEALGKLCKKRLVRDYSTGKLRRLTVYRVPDGARPAEQPRCRAA